MLRVLRKEPKERGADNAYSIWEELGLVNTSLFYKFYLLFGLLLSCSAAFQCSFHPMPQPRTTLDMTLHPLPEEEWIDRSGSKSGGVGALAPHKRLLNCVHHSGPVGERVRFADYGQEYSIAAGMMLEFEKAPLFTLADYDASIARGDRWRLMIERNEAKPRYYSVEHDLGGPLAFLPIKSSFQFRKLERAPAEVIEALEACGAVYDGDYAARFTRGVWPEHWYEVPADG